MIRNIEKSHNFSSFIEDLESITTVKSTPNYSPTTTPQYTHSVSSTIETQNSYHDRNSTTKKVFPTSIEFNVINNSSGKEQTKDNFRQLFVVDILQSMIFIFFLILLQISFRDKHIGL